MPGDWVTETGIPCFRPHVRRDDEGNVLYEITPADLAEIADQSNKFTVELHGNKPPITEGHRNFAKDAKEADQPLVLGYADNFRVSKLPDGTPCIVADRHYLAQYQDRAKRHPYPSVDYLHGKRAIVGLAKLTRPPALNTGAVYYPGTNESVYIYAAGDEPVDDQTKPTPEATPQPGPEANQAPQLTPEEVQGCEKVYAYLCSKYKWMAAAAQQYDAGPGTPNGDNTHVQGDDDKPKPKKDDKEPDMSQADTATVQQYESRIAAQEAQIAGLLRKDQERDVNALLDQLEKVERYQFDRAAEFDRLIAATAADRQKRAEEIRKYHPQTGGRVEVYAGNVTPGGPVETSRETMNAAVQYASRHNCDYDTALAAVKQGKR